MGFSPFDGVVLDEVRPPMPGAVAMLIHLRVARRRAASMGLAAPSLEAVEARAGACRELVAHGLEPRPCGGSKPKASSWANPDLPTACATWWTTWRPTCRR